MMTTQSEANISFNRKTKFRLAALIMFASSIGVSATVLANDRHERTHRISNTAYHQSGVVVAPVTLSVKVRVNGSGRIGLRGLIESQHHIDTRNFRIRSIVVGNKASYPACAELTVGRRSSGVVDLYRGVTHIPVPHGRGVGPWVLEVDAARVRRIRVELEPLGYVREHRISHRRHKPEQRSYYTWR